jgi:alcohol dehydrogenase, propanol-preferring
VQLGLDSLRKGGKLIIVGLFGGDITVPTPSFPLRAISIQGSYVGSLTEMAELLDLVRRKGAPDLPIGKRPLAAVNDALEELKSGKVVGRLVLMPAE